MLLSYMNDENYNEHLKNAIFCGFNIPVISNTYNPEIYNEDYHVQAETLLYNCFNGDKNIKTWKKTKYAIELIKKYSLVNFGYLIRGLVYYPDLLNEFLEIQKKEKAPIDNDDMASMFSDCIENNQEFALNSMLYLLNFFGNNKLEIKLLPNKINRELYNLAKLHCIQDIYYDSNSTEYHYPDLVTKKNSGKYTDYRDSYHILLYGNKEHLQSLIVYSDLWGDDDIMKAARDFFNLPHDTPLSVVIQHINNKSLLII